MISLVISDFAHDFRFQAQFHDFTWFLCLCWRFLKLCYFSWWFRASTGDFTWLVRFQATVNYLWNVVNIHSRRSSVCVFGCFQCYYCSRVFITLLGTNLSLVFAVVLNLQGTCRKRRSSIAEFFVKPIKNWLLFIISLDHTHKFILMHVHSLRPHPQQALCVGVLHHEDDVICRWSHTNIHKDIRTFFKIIIIDTQNSNMLILGVLSQ